MDAATAIGELANLVSIARTGIQTLGELRTKEKGNRQAEKALDQASEVVSGLLSHLLQFQATALQLQEENSKLREQIRGNEARVVERQQYKPTKVGASMVLMREEEPGVYYCPACNAVHPDRYVALQPMLRNYERLGSHRCVVCQNIYQL